MRKKVYCVNMNPISWNRAVKHKSTNHSSQSINKVSFGLHLNQQHNEEAPFDKPINLDIIFYLPPQQNKKFSCIYSSAPPYLSNLYKFLLESITDLLIKDESVICSLSLKKVYDKNPRTEIIITEVV